MNKLIFTTFFMMTSFLFFNLQAGDSNSELTMSQKIDMMLKQVSDFSESFQIEIKKINVQKSLDDLGINDMINDIVKFIKPKINNLRSAYSKEESDRKIVMIAAILGLLKSSTRYPCAGFIGGYAFGSEKKKK